MKRLIRIGLTVIAVMGIGLMPMLAGSGAVGSVAGSRNATLSGEALVPNTTVFSGDDLQVRDGVAVVALDAGNRMVFGRETEASFLREAKAVTVMLRRGNVSMYHPGASPGVEVKAGGMTVKPAAGYKTLGEVAMLDGALVVTAKQGMWQVESQGRTRQVAEGKTVTMPVAAAPVPAPAAPPGGDAHITTATTLGVMAVGAGTAAAILAGLGLSRSNDAKSAAEAATTAANNATAAANAATAAANAAGAAANAAGCAENIENANENPGTPSPYTPPAGYSCP